MRIKKSTLLPILLLIYLGVMAWIGYPEYAAGHTSALYYFGIIAATVCIIVLLHFSLKRRERLKSERENDIRNNASRNSESQNPPCGQNENK